MRYLKGNVSYNIHYTEYPRVLEGYCDANWISDADEMYATSEYVFLLGGGVFTVNFRQPSYEFTFNVGIDLLF
jgi:hypothetical protein